MLRSAASSFPGMQASKACASGKRSRRGIHSLLTHGIVKSGTEARIIRSAANSFPGIQASKACASGKQLPMRRRFSPQHPKKHRAHSAVPRISSQCRSGPFQTKGAAVGSHLDALLQMPPRISAGKPPPLGGAGSLDRGGGIDPSCSLPKKQHSTVQRRRAGCPLFALTPRQPHGIAGGFTPYRACRFQSASRK